jgi:amino acid transporter
MLTAAVMVMLTYLTPIAAVAWAGLPAGIFFSTGAWVDAGRVFAGAGLATAIVVAGSLDAFGTFTNLTLSYTRLPHALAEDGFLPAAFTKRLRNGAPWVAILACATCWALALGLTFERLITIDLLLWGMSIVLEFLALIILRRREPTLVRPFRIPGPEWVPIALGLCPTILIGVALYLARDEKAAHMSALVFAVLVAVAGVPLYGLAWLHKRRFARNAVTLQES